MMFSSPVSIRLSFGMSRPPGSPLVTLVCAAPER